MSAQLFLNGATHGEMCEGEMSFHVILRATSPRVVHLAWLVIPCSCSVLCSVASKQPPDNDSDLCWFLRVVLISLVTLAGGRNLDRVFATSLDNRVPTVLMFLVSRGAHLFKCLRG